jgi:hypothetical protein
MAGAATAAGTDGVDGEPADEPSAATPALEETMAAPGPIWTEEFAEPELWDSPAAGAGATGHDSRPHEVEAIIPRPLFADHERRVPPGAPPPPDRPAASFATSTGADDGPADVADSTAGSRYWPFDDPEDTGSFSGREGRSWMKLAGVVALCVALLVGTFVAFDLNRGNGDAPSAPDTTASSTPAETGSPIRIVGARDFDPEGDPPEENPDQVRLAIDGKPDTGWRTLTYKDDPRLGGLKSGVGLVLDLGSEQEVGSVTLTLVGQPTDLELYATPPGVDNPPNELADARRVGAATADGTRVVIRPDPKPRTRFLVVWLTKLPAAAGGFRGEVAEVAVRS